MTMHPRTGRSGVSPRQVAPRFGRLATLMLLSCLSFSVVSSTPLTSARLHADRKRGGKVVTRTFASRDVIAIHDHALASPYPSTIYVSGFRRGRVLDVNVHLRGLNHGRPEDIDVMLLTPANGGGVIMSDAGGSTAAANLTVTLDADAAFLLPSSDGLASGSYFPANFEGDDAFPDTSSYAFSWELTIPYWTDLRPNGAWRLYVVDVTAGSVGEFSAGWDLELSVKQEIRRRRNGV